MTATREMTDAYRAGASSWDTKVVGLVRNPHNPRAATSRERVLAEMWARGRRSRIDPAFRQQ